MTAQPDESALVLDRVARRLTDLGDELEALGARLCSDDAICARHMDVLQSIDAMAQTQRELAALLARPDRAAAVADVRLDALRQMLSQD